jgi:hypothetical protein
MSKFTLAAIFALLSASAASASPGDLRLSIANGRVTIIAQDVTLRQILDEWGRVGQTKVVGAERLAGPAITLELHDVPEGRALETLLRSASGYIAKPRSGTVGVSSYDRILIMAASTPPVGGRAAAPPPYNARQPQVMVPNVVIDDDEPTPNGIMPPGSVPQQFQQFQGQPPPPMVPMTQPGMQPVQPGQMPTMTRPGMLPPPAPNMPGNPYQTNPQQPVIIRPPGTPGPGGEGGER